MQLVYYAMVARKKKLEKNEETHCDFNQLVIKIKTWHIKRYVSKIIKTEAFKQFVYF